MEVFNARRPEIETSMVNVLRQNVGGPARKWYHTPPKELRQDWTTLKTLFILTFLPKPPTMWEFKILWPGKWILWSNTEMSLWWIIYFDVKDCWESFNVSVCISQPHGNLAGASRTRKSESGSTVLGKPERHIFWYAEKRRAGWRKFKVTELTMPFARVRIDWNSSKVTEEKELIDNGIPWTRQFQSIFVQGSCDPVSLRVRNASRPKRLRGAPWPSRERCTYRLSNRIRVRLSINTVESIQLQHPLLQQT